MLIPETASSIDLNNFMNCDFSGNMAHYTFWGNRYTGCDFSGFRIDGDLDVQELDLNQCYFFESNPPEAPEGFIARLAVRQGGAS